MTHERSTHGQDARVTIGFVRILARGEVPLIKFKHVILIAIVVLAVWALLPPDESTGKPTIRLGTDPRRLQNLPPEVRYIIRVHPGAYLPGLMPDNVGKPLDGMNQVAFAFERKFPDTRIEFVGVPGGAREWLVTQLSSGQAPDIVQVNVEEVWQDVQKGWYVPLNDYLDGPNPFITNGQPGSDKWWDVFKYPTPTRGTCAPDGNFYCVTTDMIETGIYYNKDIFKKLGLAEPKDWPDFLAIQQKIRDAGYIPTLVERAAFTDWGIDLTFYQLYSDIQELLDLRYDARSGDYLKGYLDWDEIAFLHSKGFFSPKDPRWVEMFRILKQWRGYMSRNLGSTEMLKSFVTQRGAMLWSHSMVVNRLSRDPDVAFDWGIFYLPPIPRSFNKFAAGRPQCVIGGSGMQYEISNSALRDTDPKLPLDQRMRNSQRLKRVVAFLQFLTVPQNTDAVVNEMVALLPNVKGADHHPQLQPFHDFLQRDYSMTKWYYTFDLQFDEVLLRMFELYLNDGISEPEFLDWMQRNLDTACEKVVKRKNINLAALEAEWNKRAAQRKAIPDLPPEAY